MIFLMLFSAVFIKADKQFKPHLQKSYLIIISIISEIQQEKTY
jgi:hypothetical protein